MKKYFNWANSLPDYAKAPAGVATIMTICYILLGIGLATNKVSLGEFLSHDNAGTAGQILFWLFAAVWVICWIVALTAKRSR